MWSLETLEQQLRRHFLFIHTTRSRSENKNKVSYPYPPHQHKPNPGFQAFDLQGKKLINLPVLVQKELKVLKREARHLSLPLPNPGTWMPGQLLTTAPKPKAALNTQILKCEPSVGLQHKPHTLCGKPSKILQAQ